MPVTSPRLAVLVLPFTVAVSLLLAACGGGGGSGTGGSVPASLSFAASTGATGTPLATPQAALGNGVDVTVFRFGASRIQLEQHAGSEEENEAQFRGEFIVDLLAGTIVDVAGGGAATDLPGFLPPGTYEELKFKLTPLPGVDPARPDVAVALQVEGSYLSGVETRPFSITVTVPLQLQVQGPNAIDLSGGSNDLIVALRLDRLLSPSNLDALIAALGVQADPTSGVYAISVGDGTPPESLGAFMQMLHGALEFGEDRNGDHELDDDEEVHGGQGPTDDVPPAQSPDAPVDDHGHTGSDDLVTAPA